MTLDTSDQNIYQAIGVEPIINCRGTFTIIGGSVELPEVVAAMEAASGYFVQYDELAEAVGQRLAEITGADWGLIPAGCAAGLKHITAACVTGGNPEKLIRIPDLTGLDKTQVIIPRYSRNAYDHALRSIGVEIVMVETREELERAINPRTAMIYITTGAGSATDQPLSLEVIADVARPHKIPILADSAAENLTIPNVHLQRGATVVAYSGGKALCGPQCAGLVLGDKALLQSAWQFSSPHHGPGRDDKIGKEEIMGMLAAVEAWVRRDHAAPNGKLGCPISTISPNGCAASTAYRPKSKTPPACPTAPQSSPSVGTHPSCTLPAQRWPRISPATNPALPWPAAVTTAALPSASRPTRCSRATTKWSPTESTAFYPRNAVPNRRS